MQTHNFAFTPHLGLSSAAIAAIVVAATVGLLTLLGVGAVVYCMMTGRGLFGSALAFVTPLLHSHYCKSFFFCHFF